MKILFSDKLPEILHVQYDTETYNFEKAFYPGVYKLQSDTINGHPFWMKEAVW